MISVTTRRRLIALPLVGLAALGLATVFGDDETVRAQNAAGPVGIEAQIGPADRAAMLGPARDTGVPGEAWALSTENLTSRVPKTVDGQPLPETKDYILRYRPAEGWRYVQAPLDEQGGPFAGTLENGRVTAKGGLLFGGVDSTRPAGQQRVVLVRDATGPTRVVTAPPSGTLRPAQGSTPAEVLSSSVLAARDDGSGRTEGFVAITGRPQQTGVARWDGTSWTRETICVAEDGTAPPAGCTDAETLKDAEFGLTASALATVEGGDAWLLASAHTDTGRGLVLFRRTGSGADARWALRDVGAPRFAAAETPADGITAVGPLAGSHAAVATTDGVWLDATFRQNGAARTATLRITPSGTRSWCDGGTCDAPLGFGLRTDATSQAFADGTRVIGPVGEGTARYARFDGTTWSVSAAFGSITGGVAFSSLDEGWVNDVHVTRNLASSPLAAWSVPVRRPLTAIASAPGAPADIATPALAVGLDGNVLRYTPGQGWDSEVRIGGSGVVRDDLRGVAWPETSTAFAVGDEGAMWRWRKATGLWESDPAAPFDFTGHLTGIAFQPGNPDRGFAVGRDGVVLRYGKSWEPMELPAELATAGPGNGKVDLFGVTFAGAQAIAAAGNGGILVEDGSGWRVDEQAAALLKPLGLNARIFAVAGLPDGGAVAAGSAGDNRGLVLERDGPTSPWRFSDQPPTGGVIAAAAFREEGQVRALVSVTPQVWPTVADLSLPEYDPNSPTPRRAPLSVPVDGYLLRQTAVGWRDEERTKLMSPNRADPSRKSDPSLAVLADASGRGWAVGGWNGGSDSLGRGPLPSEPPREDFQTASVNRYDPAGPVGSSNVRVAPPTLQGTRARLLVGGHAQCADACADLAPIDLSPDRTLARSLGLAANLAAQAGGPTALAYTGGRLPVSGAGNVAASGAELQRYGALLGGAALPTFPVVSAGEATGGTSSGFESVFGGSWAPFGNGAAGAGTRPVAIGADPVPGRARTHYAVDLDTAGGTVRLIAIDNASGSLAARNAVGNPVQDQAAWLTQVLSDAKTRRIPTVVVGSRSLNARDTGAASDAATVAAILRDGGASAYVFDGAGEQRRASIPANSTVTLPSFASGTLGYRGLNDVEGRGVPGLLLLEFDVAARNATTNRAPVGVRLVPVLDDLAIDAVDGRLLNRSQPARFEGLGRRPRSGDTGDPYVQLPSPLCGATTREACAQTRIDPEVTFHSSDPDIADFVRVDPASTNPRKPFIDASTDKPVPDATSGLICPYNAGTTTISISSGGLTYSTTITVRDGSVLRPCGTVPLNPARFEKPSAGATPPPPASAPPGGGANPTSAVTVPPPPVPAAPAVGPAPPATPTPSIPVAAVAVPAMVAPVIMPPLAVPPPPAAGAPAPPPGTSGASINVPVSQPVTQAERQREEEVAEESSQAYARYESTAATNRGSGPGDNAAIVAAVLLAAIGGGTALGARRRHVNYAYARDRQTRTRRTR